VTMTTSSARPPSQAAPTPILSARPLIRGRWTTR
jgi:hypothetical protein